MQHRPIVFSAKKLPRKAAEELEKFCDATYWEGDGPIPQEELLASVREAEGLIVSSETVDEALLAAAPKLRAVSTVSVGYNHLDLAALRARGIPAAHTPYVLDDTVADLVLALMLAAARRVTELDAIVKAGGWTEPAGPEWFGMDVHHATLGIIGLGRIGEKIAKRAVHGFDMKLLYHNRSRNIAAEERFGARYASLEELLSESDFVVLMTPLTPETKRFFRMEHFRMMKKTAFFINASRGAVVDETALVEALKSGVIRGAGLDVYEREPIGKDHPLLSLTNVVTLPHIGSATASTRDAMAMTAVRNLLLMLRGKDGAHLINA